MRVYLPATSTVLAELHSSGTFGAPPTTGFAVTPALRAWFVDDDDEELEYAAMLEAARGSLRLIDSDPLAQRRRVVVVADIAHGDIEVHDDIDRGVIRVARAVTITDVAAIHADLADAVATISTAAAAILSADLGDAVAAERVDDAEGFDLAWFATQEIEAVLAVD